MNVEVGRLTVRAARRGAGRDAGFRVRAESRLRALDLYPAGLPAHAVLIVRRLELPAAGPGTRSQAQAALDQLRRTAARPAAGPVAAGAQAVLFGDEVELLGCLTADLVHGVAGQRWYWRQPGPAGSGGPGAALAAAWLRDVRWLPGCLARLGEREARQAVSLLPATEATRVLRAMLAAFGVDDPRSGAAGPAPEAPWRRWLGPTSLPPEAEALWGVALSLHHAPAVVRGPGYAGRLAGWRAAAGQAGAAARAGRDGIRAEGIRAGGFPAERAWAEGTRAEGEPTGRDQAGAGPSGTGASGTGRGGDGQAGSELASGELAGRAPTGGDATGTEAAGAEREAGKLAGWEQAGREHAAGERADGEQASREQAEGGRAGREPEERGPEREAPAGADPAGAARTAGGRERDAVLPHDLGGQTPRRADRAEGQQEAGTSPAAGGGSGEREAAVPAGGPARAQDGVVSGLASVLFLVNFVVWLDDRTAEARPGGWTLVELLARYLLAGDLPGGDLPGGDLPGGRACGLVGDPLWEVLARLDGRRPGTVAVAGIGAADPVRLPRAWLERWPPPAAGYVARRAAGRLVIRHREAGFVAADVPCPAGAFDEVLAAEAVRLGDVEVVADVVDIEGGPDADAEVGAEVRAETEADAADAGLAGGAGGRRFGESVGAFVGWLLRSRGIGVPALTAPGRVLVTGTHVDVVLSLRDIDLAVRVAGLDRDPGWVPALGRIVLFHFQDA